MLPFPADPHPPLSGVRVLDAARVLAGPFCGQLLADLGAEVIKLERPGQGDDTRGWGPPYVDGFADLSAYFLSCNRGKRALTLDIGTPDGNDLFHRLLAKCDVLIENFRTDSAEKLKLTPDALLARHPRLIACSISGFGRTGPMRDAPGYDFAVQALSGLMGITGPAEGPPSKVGVAVADVLTGLYASNAILAALHARARTGHGYAIDLALMDCALAAQVNVAQAYLTGGAVPARQGNAHLQIVPYQLFATADGWLVLNVGNDGQWRAFCTAAGAPELGADPRFATNRQRVERRTEVVPQVEALMARVATAEWETRLERAARGRAHPRRGVPRPADAGPRHEGDGARPGRQPGRAGRQPGPPARRAGGGADDAAARRRADGGRAARAARAGRRGRNRAAGEGRGVSGRSFTRR
jgi:crotonobetainyl-CoA:carnitine CoA-transferase CaiB-like acyl-CoA transferase